LFGEEEVRRLVAQHYRQPVRSTGDVLVRSGFFLCSDSTPPPNTPRKTGLVLAVILFGITTATESAAVGAAGAFLLAFQARTLDWKRTKEAVFLTAKTTAMVCWLFVGSALFSAVFAILGGQGLVERWALSLDMTLWLPTYLYGG
jgi:predicted histidine transporter YuiF (NhaC family)